jgi:glycosyltransferase involved in cell wall biosynthesis
VHVGLNLMFWQADSGGPGVYARELIRALPEADPQLRITAWVGRGAPPELETAAWAQGVDWVRLPLRTSGSPVHVGYELGILGLDARRRSVDVVHGLAYATPLLAPGVATVVTLLDLTWRHHRGSTETLARVMFTILTAACSRRADRIVAVSQEAKRDLVRTLGLDEDRIDVTPLGVAEDVGRVPPESAETMRARFGVPAGAPVILCIAQLARHKNLGVLVRALPELQDAQLVLVGRELPYREELRAMADELGVSDRVVMTGFVTESEREGFFALADCLALPSISEGFGLPVVEAMRRDLPVACSAASALPEVAGGAAELFDPHDVDSVVEALRRVLYDDRRRAELVSLGRARAAELTWARTAEATLACYRRALEQRS